jgi:hypothetical protein
MVLPHARKHCQHRSERVQGERDGGSGTRGAREVLRYRAACGVHFDAMRWALGCATD